MGWTIGSKENSYRKDLRKKAMKPDFPATKGRHAQNKNGGREWTWSPEGPDVRLRFEFRKSYRCCLPGSVCSRVLLTNEGRILP